jgi:hypothetical protein
MSTEQARSILFTELGKRGWCSIQRVADAHHFNSTPDPGPAPNLKVMRICDHWSTDPLGLDFECPSLHCERPRPNTAPFEPLKLLNPDLNPASENNANPCGSGSTLLLSSTVTHLLYCTGSKLPSSPISQPQEN